MQGVTSVLQAMWFESRATNSTLMREFKITGTIGTTSQKDHITYINLCSQIEDVKSKGYSQEEITQAIWKAVSAGTELFLMWSRTCRSKQRWSLCADFCKRRPRFVQGLEQYVPGREWKPTNVCSESDVNTGEDTLAMMKEEIQSIRNDMSQMDDQRFGSGRGGGRGRGGGGGWHRKPGCEHCVRDGKGSTCHHCWICGAGDHVSFDKQLEAADEGHSSASVNQSMSHSYDEQDLKITEFIIH